MSQSPTISLPHFRAPIPSKAKAVKDRELYLLYLLGHIGQSVKELPEAIL
jgi:hypothetical protein